jgi:hypothetical protein
VTSIGQEESTLLNIGIAGNTSFED